MIAPPVNDVECLTRLTLVAEEGTQRSDVRALAHGFAKTSDLVSWIRALPQRDDAGEPSDGPRVSCDVSQRARLLADDPNCVERALLYLAAAELIDPRPTRQLVTVDLDKFTRHTFPIEDGEPVVLDPELRRNALRGALWRYRNGQARQPVSAPVDLAPLVAWMLDVSRDEAIERDDMATLERIDRADRAIHRLMRGGPVTVSERADVVIALRFAASAVEDFGPAATDGYALARTVLLRQLTRPRRQAVRVDPERAVYWGGKAVASAYGLGGVYDAAYGEVLHATRRPRRRRRRPRPQQERTPAAMVQQARPKNTGASGSTIEPGDQKPPESTRVDVARNEGEDEEESP